MKVKKINEMSKDKSQAKYMVYKVTDSRVKEVEVPFSEYMRKAARDQALHIQYGVR